MKTKELTLYVDMDGVLSNFEKSYRSMWNDFKYDRIQFRTSVIERNIFSNLEKMPNADKLLEKLRVLETLYGLNIEILTSTGSPRTEMKVAGMEQKREWLDKHGINWKANFVCSKPEKAQYASSTAILLDDMEGCTIPFKAQGGMVFLYDDHKNTEIIQSLQWYLDEYSNEYI